MKKTISLLFTLFLLLSTTALADGPEDPKELEAFLDGIIQTQMEIHQIPGITISVVKDGKIFLSKGYGFANIENQLPVNPNKTLFRIGSVSKLFTWTAIMQLHEQGKLDLNKDINEYLTNLNLPNTYPEPITLTHLLTHTAGFEEKQLKVAQTKEEILPLTNDFLKNNMPKRIYPPGKITAYSNYGVDVAGLIVQEVSGTKFEDYIKKHILTPLEMDQSSFYQPTKPGLESQFATAYTYNYGFKESDPFFFGINTPAGTMTSTADEMANFMIAHLQNGQYKNNSILKPGTTEKMHTQIFAYHTKLNGMCYGFYEMNQNPRVIGHEGGTPNFRTLLAIIPEKNFGIFISSSAGTQFIARSHLLPKIINRYYKNESKVQPKNITQEKASRLIGQYKFSRNTESNYEKIIEFMYTINIDYKNNQLVIGQTPFTEIEPLVFQSTENEDLMVFKENENKEITEVYFSGFPYMIGIKQKWYQNHSLHISSLITCITIFAYTFITWPIYFWKNRKKKKKKLNLKSLPLIAKVTAWAMSAFYAIPLLVITITFSEKSFQKGFPPLLAFSFNMTVIAAILTIPTVVFAILAWKNKFWKLKTRIFYTLLTLASMLFIWLINYWNFWLFLN